MTEHASQGNADRGDEKASERSDPLTPGGRPQEDVEDRPDIAPVTPEDYPEADRAESGPTGGR